jgi:VanZ family protein
MDFRIAIRTCAALRTLAFAAFVAIVVQLVALPPQPIAYEVIAVSSDKAVHAVVFSTLAFLLWIVTRGRWPLAILALVGGLGASDEIVQYFRPDRTADLLDLAADLGGAGFTLLFLNRFALAAVPAARPKLSSSGA